MRKSSLPTISRMPPLKKQSGATLVVALVILMIISVVASSNMYTSTLQEHMAGNSRQKSVSKYAAESALNIGEKWIDENINSLEDIQKFSGKDGLYSAVNTGPTTAPVPSEVDIPDLGSDDSWGNITAYTSPEKIINEDLVSRQPQYIIEYIGRDYRGAGSKVVGTDDLSRASKSLMTKPYFFRITAIGWGKDSRIYTVLESTYKTGSGEFFNY